jgi:predicted metal-dependent hydrolase
MNPYDYRLVYSNRRSVGITVERDGEVVVRAPHGLSDEKLQEVLRARRRWVEAKVSSPQKYAPVHAPGKELVSGESMLFLGQPYQVDRRR